MTNKSEKAYFVLLLFMPIFPSQPEDLGGGMGAEKISMPAYSRAGKDWHLSFRRTLTQPLLTAKDKKKISHQKNPGQISTTNF
jgi:hypothetical protein